MQAIPDGASAAVGGSAAAFALNQGLAVAADGREGIELELGSAPGDEIAGVVVGGSGVGIVETDEDDGV